MAKQTILLIDYEPRSIERFRQPLTDAGYVVEVATDGISGIEAFHRLNPDMVLVEAMIPKKHGFEVCQELKRTPHGRRTPVLITTGVYKGRKYRTQALHIYGCDEYIEKPIAPEQLLAVVGKFFGASAGAPAVEAGSTPPVNDVAIVAGEGGDRAPAPSRAPDEPAAPRAHPMKPTSTPTAVMKDFTEEEIMARLDAILPSGELNDPADVDVAPAPVTMVRAPEPVAAVLQSIESVAGQDPFLQMQAELSAELGSLSAALALEPAPVFDPIPQPIPQPIPSDQVVSPSVLEALSLLELENVSAAPETSAAPEPAVAPAPSEEQPGQVVSFDAKRSRKSKKHGRKAQDRAAAQPPPAPAPNVEAVGDETPKVEAAAPEHAPLSVPFGSLVESELESATRNKGVPLWVWAAVVVVGLIAIYLTMLRGAATPSDASPAQPAAEQNDTNTGADPDAAAGARGAAATDGSSLVLNSVNARSPRSQAPPETPAPAASRVPAPAAGTSPAEQDSQLKPQNSATTSLSLSEWPKKAAAPSSAPPEITTRPVESAPQGAGPIDAAPAGLDESVAGVETITEPSVDPVAPSIAPGTLVAAEDLDTAPVSLSRRLPTYSMQARQMRLQGTIVMKVLVNERGTVDDVVLVNGVPGADLNDSAIRAAKTWTYRPASKSGVPVKVWKVEQVVFKM